MASFDPYSRIVDWLAANLPDEMKDDFRSFLRDLTLAQHNAERADNGLPPETHEEVQARLESLYGG